MTDVLLRRYTFKLYPTAAQEATLREHLLMMGQLWNALLQRREDVYRREGRTLSAYEQKKEITQLRAECPEWAALSVAAARGVVDRLDNAFKAFFRRAKAGAGAQSGYPRYRRADRWSSISFTECCGSGWRIWQEKPGKGGWRLRVKGVTGPIKARGLLPGDPKSWHTGEVIWRDGAWWLSVVCGMESRRKAGDERIAISFDLIDEFAVVEAVDGRFPTGSKEQAPPNISTAYGNAPADTPNLEGDGNWMSGNSAPFVPADTPNLEGDGNGTPGTPCRYRPADTPNLGGDGNQIQKDMAAGRPADTPNLGGDGNHVLRAAGAGRPADTPNLEGDGNLGAHSPPLRRPADTPNLEGDGNSGLGRVDLGPLDAPDLEGDGNYSLTVPSIASPANTPDLIQSNRDRRYRKFSWRWRREKKRIARIKARDARRRRYIHHGWSTALVRQARDLTVSVPSIPQWTESPRGNARNWGANVAVVSSLNRHILGQAPMLAVSMLQYKAAEAGIRCDVVKDDEAPDIAVGRDMVVVGKAKRRLRRAIKKEAA